MHVWDPCACNARTSACRLPQPSLSKRYVHLYTSVSNHFRGWCCGTGSCVWDSATWPQTNTHGRAADDGPRTWNPACCGFSLTQWQPLWPFGLWTSGLKICHFICHVLKNFKLIKSKLSFRHLPSLISTPIHGCMPNHCAKLIFLAVRMSLQDIRSLWMLSYKNFFLKITHRVNYLITTIQEAFLRNWSNNNSGKITSIFTRQLIKQHGFLLHK